RLQDLSEKARFIVEYFRHHTMAKIDGRGKAIVAAASRLHAVRYKQAIDSYIATNDYFSEVATLVAFPGQVLDGRVSFTESGLNGFPESETAGRFNTDDFQILIVAGKSQTEYGKMLHTLFVDKAITGIAAVRTLSWLDQTHPLKANA